MRRLLALLSSVALGATLLVALPSAAHAAPGSDAQQRQVMADLMISYLDSVSPAKQRTLCQAMKVSPGKVLALGAKNFGSLMIISKANARAGLRAGVTEFCAHGAAPDTAQNAVAGLVELAIDAKVTAAQRPAFCASYKADPKGTAGQLSYSLAKSLAPVIPAAAVSAGVTQAMNSICPA